MGAQGYVSYCGMDCSGCLNYKQNMNCAGCREEAEMLEDCPTRACAMARELRHCGACGDFPCKELSAFYNDGKAIHKQAHQNMLELLKTKSGPQ